MKKISIYNGENIDITVVTDAGEFVIPAGKSKEIKAIENAVFNTSDLYVEEPGSWYIKTEHCRTGADAEIYDAAKASAAHHAAEANA